MASTTSGQLFKMRQAASKQLEALVKRGASLSQVRKAESRLEKLRKRHLRSLSEENPKKRKPAQKRPGKKNSRKAPKRSGRSAKKNSKRFKTAYGYAGGGKSKKKKRISSGGTMPRKKAPKKTSNPGKALKSKIAQMKPNTWYPTTLSGAKVKVKRTGTKLVIMPTKRRAS